MFQERLTSLRGYQAALACFAAGAVSVLALPPVGLFPVWLLTLPAFFILTRNIGRKAAFLRGWAFGAGYFIFGLYWISYALFVDFEKFKWVLPFSLIVGPAVFGLYYGFIPLLARAVTKARCHRAVAFIISFALIEFLRGHLFTGFPWNLPGYSWDRVLPLLQPASLIGIYGLSALTLFWALTPVFWRNKALTWTAAGSFIAAAAFGFLTLGAKIEPPKDAPLVRIVQASIPQNMKWDGDQEWKNLEKHALLSKGAARDGRLPIAVVWPETSVTTDLQAFPEIARYISSQLPKGSLGLLGNLRFTMNAAQTAPEEYFNSLQVLTRGGKILATYDKHHLVPFGEYIPFRDKINLTPLALAITGLGDFTAGPGPGTLAPQDGFPPFSPLICYEVIFPSQVVDKTNRPVWLVNITNDAWYGHTAGPYQHLAISRLRAIEQGLPLARAANNGISAMIDAQGRIVASLPLDAVGALDVALPPPAATTLYSRFGDATFAFVLVLLYALGFWRRRDA